MGYEIDFIGIGKESQSGDAIAIRYGDLFGSRSAQKVVLIDSGFQSSGEAVSEHIKKYFDTDHIDLAISTHPDQDHIGGFQTIFEDFSVGEFWMHLPWEHNQGLADQFADGRITDESMAQRLRDSLQAAYEVHKLAVAKGIAVVEPFTGVNFDNGTLAIQGPTLGYYEELIPEFDGMPKKKMGLGEQVFAEAGKVLKMVKRAVLWGQDHLDDEDTTSARNNSSAITQLVLSEKRFLLTADAGIAGLSHAADHIDVFSGHIPLKFIQIPHHGSRRNVGPTIMDRLVGNKISEGATIDVIAYASAAPKGAPKHPHAAVLNAFAHRGAQVGVTRGVSRCHRDNAPDRGWSAAANEPYHYNYEEEV